jgi:hypothetical protein
VVRTDPATATLAANAITILMVLMPYAAIGAQEFVKSPGKEAYDKVKSLPGTLKARWTRAVEPRRTGTQLPGRIGTPLP